MPQAGLSAFLFLALCAAPAAGQVSSAQEWELTRSLSGGAGETRMEGGTDRLGHALGEAFGLGDLSGGTDILLPGYLSSFPPSVEMVEQLVSLGSVTFHGTAVVLDSADALRLRFNVDVEPASIPGSVSVAAVLDPMANPTYVPWAATASYDAAGLQAVVTPDSGNWSLGTLYELYVSTQVTDVSGNTRTSVATMTFTVIRDPAVDNVAVVRYEPSIRVPIPANSFSAPFAMLMASGTDTAAVREANAKAIPSAGEPLKVVEVETWNASGQEWSTPISPPLAMVFPYTDVDGDGLLEGSDPAVRARLLSVWRLDEGLNLWTKQWGATVDQPSRRVTYRTDHFSTFGLFGTPDTEVSGVYAFPVPFRPNAGDPARYGTWAGGIKFVNLPTEGTINIYTISGVKVRSLPITLPLMSWDARNGSGETVASGVYIWEVRSGSNHKTGKLMIVK